MRSESTVKVFSSVTPIFSLLFNISKPSARSNIIICKKYTAQQFCTCDATLCNLVKCFMQTCLD